MNLPPIVYSLRFWEALTLVVAVFVVRGEYYPVELTVQILGIILAVLRLIGVNPQIISSKLTK